MKYKIISIILLSIIYSCTSEEQGPKDLRNVSLSLAADNYYRADVYSGHLYLSNENGEIVDHAELVNNSTTELIMDYDANDEFDLTVADRLELERSNEKFVSYRLKTFNSIEPHNFIIEEPQISYADENASAFVNITNTEGQIRDILTGNYYNRNLSETEANFEFYLLHAKEEIYLSFIPSGKDLPRYVLLEDVENGFSTNLDVNELPLARDQVVINYPPIDELSVSIWGARSSDPNNFFAYLSRDSGTNPPYSIHYIPLNEFVWFKETTRFDIGNKSYEKIVIDDVIRTDFEIPVLDFQITNSINETYEFLPKTDFDYYTIRLYYLNEAENYEIIWDYYGKPTNGSIKIRYPNVLEELGPETMPSSVNDFNLYKTEIKNVQGIDSYSEYCNITMDPTVSLESKSSKIESMKIEQQ